MKVNFDNGRLIDKVPEFLYENVEINAVFDAIQPELDLLYARIEQVFKNIHIETADSNGLKVYEEWLGIPYDQSLTLKQRRAEVLARLNETLPYTEIRLQRFLAGIVGWGHFRYVRDGARVSVYLDNTCIESADSVFSMLERILPLNLHFEVVLLHSTETNTVKFGIGTCITDIVVTPINKARQVANLRFTSGSISTEIIETR